MRHGKRVLSAARRETETADSEGGPYSIISAEGRSRLSMVVWGPPSLSNTAERKGIRGFIKTQLLSYQDNIVAEVTASYPE